MADAFVIGGTEFGVDRGSVKLEFPLRPDGLVNVHLEVAGDEAVFESVSEDERWSWALYPPFFCVRRFAVSPADAELVRPIQIPKRDGTFEMNLYMMEYCEVTSVVVQREVDGISIEGRVDMWGKDMSFRIQLDGAYEV
jgi:hypothetical protein